MNVLSVSNLYSEALLGGFCLSNISFTQSQFEKIAIIGETGSGKSTLLKTIAGLIEPKVGTIIFNNKKVLGPNWQLVPGQKGIAYLSQHFELRNNYRMEELLAINNEFTEIAAQDLYKICRISHLLKRNSYQLSGGEKQRVALATLLVQKPSLLILDEPFSNLDFIHKNILKTVLHDVSKEYNINYILSSHEPSDVLPWADKIIALREGNIEQIGTVAQLYNKPINEYVAGLLGNFTKLNKELATLLNIKFEKNIFLRPEQISIENNNNTLKNATVVDCFFMGAYYQIVLEFFGGLFISNYSKPLLPGQNVLIKIIF